MKRIVLTGILLCSSMLHAAPALQQERFFKQPDGTIFKGASKGDEYLHWIETQDGDIVIFDRKNKRYEQAVIGKEKLLGSGALYHRPEHPSAPESLKEKHDDLKKLWLKKREERTLLRQGKANN